MSAFSIVWRLFYRRYQAACESNAHITILAKHQGGEKPPVQAYYVCIHIMALLARRGDDVLQSGMLCCLSIAPAARSIYDSRYFLKIAWRRGIGGIVNSLTAAPFLLQLEKPAAFNRQCRSQKEIARRPAAMPLVEAAWRASAA